MSSVEKSWHSSSEKSVLEELHASRSGLSQQEVNDRLNTYGLNILPQKSSLRPLKILLNQFTSVLVLILLAAVVLSVLIGEVLDAIVIGSILVLNGLLGFIQEYRAEKSLEALKALTSQQVHVQRNNTHEVIDATLLVPGDIMLIEEGLKVPADARLLEAYELTVDESTLTGESSTVEKKVGVLAEKTPVADRKNMVFSGTSIARGKGVAVVTGTGIQTELGTIANLLQDIEHAPTPLQLQLKILGKMLGIITAVIALAVFAGGIIQGNAWEAVFITAVALAVAAIPEGLPAIVTIGLALGTQRMAKKNVIVRKLPSVETLGSTSVICADKTGTLTKNQMTVEQVFVDNKMISVADRFAQSSSSLKKLLEIGLLCNNTVEKNGKIIGDPTEGALLVSARKAKVIADAPRIHEIPFSSEKKYMATVHQIKKKKVLYMKGAPDVVIHKCSRMLINGKVIALSSTMKKKILQQNEAFSSKSLRVLAFAFSKNEKSSSLIFVGLQAMKDPIRPDAKKAVQECMAAGIKIIMITGDHQKTAEAIGKELGLKGKVMTGEEIDRIKELSSVVEGIAIFARVNPSHKLNIIQALKKKGHVVAMTGDGVNDAPALKDADIGIAMGLSGTDVAKEASDMVLLDDNFASIVAAVKEGRSIYDNIVKFVGYLVSSNIGEVLTVVMGMILGSLWGLPLPVIAIQLLWINLVTDGLPALALSIDPADPHSMEKKPRKSTDQILTRSRIIKMILIGVSVMIGTIVLFIMALRMQGWVPNGMLDLSQYLVASTVAFSALVIFQMVNVLNYQTESRSVLKSSLLKNKWLIGAILSSIVLQIMVIYSPLNTYFKTVPLAGMAWGWILIAACGILVIGEVVKKVIP